MENISLISRTTENPSQLFLVCHTTLIFLGTWGQSICSAVTVATAGSLLLLTASGTILLALYCWTLQIFPFWSLTCFLCNKPLVGGLKPSEIQLYKTKTTKKYPYSIAQFNLQCLYKERRTRQGTGHSKLCISFHSDKNLISWHYEFVVNAAIPAWKVFLSWHTSWKKSDLLYFLHADFQSLFSTAGLTWKIVFI